MSFLTYDLAIGGICVCGINPSMEHTHVPYILIA
jgi:hypothetical protein